MRKEYTFTSAKPNPYIKQLKKAVSIRLEPDVIEYFKQFALETRIPYQNLINLYLLDCARVQRQRKISLQWGTEAFGPLLPSRATKPSAPDARPSQTFVFPLSTIGLSLRFFLGRAPFATSAPTPAA